MTFSNKFSTHYNDEFASEKTLKDIDDYLRSSTSINVNLPNPSQKEKLIIDIDSYNDTYTFLQSVNGNYRLLKTHLMPKDNIPQDIKEDELSLLSNNDRIDYKINKGFYIPSDFIDVTQDIGTTNGKFIYGGNRFGYYTILDNADLYIKPHSADLLDATVKIDNVSDFANWRWTINGNNVEITNNSVGTDFKFEKGFIPNTFSIRTVDGKYLKHNNNDDPLTIEDFVDNPDFKDKTSFSVIQRLFGSNVNSFCMLTTNGRRIVHHGYYIRAMNVIPHTKDTTFVSFVSLNNKKITWFGDKNFYDKNKYPKNMLIDFSTDNNKQIKLNLTNNIPSASIIMSNNEGNEYEYSFTQESSYEQIVNFTGVTSGRITLKDTNNNIHKYEKLQTFFEKI